MAKRPIPVIVVSTESNDGQLVLQALELGAVDFVRKPTILASEKLFEISDELLAKVKLAATTELQSRNALPLSSETLAPIGRRKSNIDVVVLGISTGGPQALKYLIPRLPADFPVPLVIVLHMPVGYTELFARSLNDVSTLEVREVQEGDVLRQGVVLLAQAGYHLVLVRDANNDVSAHLDIHPLDTPHRPSVDVLFKSAAEIYGDRVLAVVMTGMGLDGTAGTAWIKAKGGQVMVESEESCVVYGMPRSVVEAGLCDKIVPLNKMAASILECL